MSHDPHAPNRLSRHVSIHTTKMAEYYARGFVGCDTLEYIVEDGTHEIQQVGEIGCLGEIVLSIRRNMEIVDPDPESDPVIHTYYYAYNASVRNHETFLRYDNAPHPPGPDWKDQHHRHFGDWRTGEYPDSPQWTGIERWPKLGDFIEEVEKWYWEHRSELPNRDAYPILGLSGAR